MRQEIEEMAASGRSEAAIIAHYKAQYGERILIVPDGGTGGVLFIAPVAGFLICSSILFLVLRRMVHASARHRSRSAQEELDRLRGKWLEVMERELRDLA